MENRRKRILIVDDFSANRDLYSYILSEKGFKVTTADNGQQALDKALELLPDLIIMDLSLPIVSGSEATGRLKADERTRHIPIIVITAYEADGLTAGLGCDDALTQPCMPDVMVGTITRLLDRHNSSKRGVVPPYTQIAGKV